MRDVDTETLEGLATKLDGLDLNETEQALLERLLDRATAFQPEVAGFMKFSYGGDMSGADLSPMGFKLGRGLDLFPATLGYDDPFDPTKGGGGGPGKPPPP